MMSRTAKKGVAGDWKSQKKNGKKSNKMRLENNIFEWKGQKENPKGLFTLAWMDDVFIFQVRFSLYPLGSSLSIIHSVLGISNFIVA